MYMRAINDPFLERFFARIPQDVAASFDDDQLLAIKKAFAESSSRTHSLDIRLSVPLLFKRFYFVVIAGPERRTKARRVRQQPGNKSIGVTNVVFSLSVLAVTLLGLAGAAYVVKSAFGIDLVADTSLGLWTEIKTQVRLMLR